VRARADARSLGHSWCDKRQVERCDERALAPTAQVSSHMPEFAAAQVRQFADCGGSGPLSMTHASLERFRLMDTAPLGRGSAEAITTAEAGSHSTTLPARSVTVPEDGGAIRRIGEKFTTNPVDSTGSLTVPISVSPGRSGFGSEVMLSYRPAQRPVLRSPGQGHPGRDGRRPPGRLQDLGQAGGVLLRRCRWPPGRLTERGGPGRDPDPAIGPRCDIPV
jgi:hypothetical protein